MSFQLLIGIKDTNDYLVSVTLIALSDLVPVLGAAVVIGGKRLRLFNDGRPNMSYPRADKPRPPVERRVSAPEAFTIPQVLELPERPSPDGGEDLELTETHATAEEDLDSWSDWDAEENQQTHPVESVMGQQFETEQAPQSVSLSNKALPRTEINTDILNLDIKSLKSSNTETNELDYFLDMEPVIEKTNKFFIEESSKTNGETAEESKISQLAMQAEENPNEEFWGEDLSWVGN